MTHTLVLQAAEKVTHDTFHLTFHRPPEFEFEQGQATELAFQKDGIKSEGRPFTMVSQPGDATLEFVIKSYPDHEGVTAHLPELEVPDTADATDPFGAISDHGAGVFLAAGAGITPFIPILKKHAQHGIGPDLLIYGNQTDADIILEETWNSLAGVTPVHVISDQKDSEHRKGQIDRALLEELIEDTGQPIYVCGPPGFVDAMRDAVTEMASPRTVW